MRRREEPVVACINVHNRAANLISRVLVNNDIYKMQGLKVQLKVCSKEKEIGDREKGKIWGSEDTGVRNGSGEA